MVVPIIFDSDHDTPGETVLQREDCSPIQNVVPERIDSITFHDPDDDTLYETILQINNATPIQNIVPECNCASMEETIQIQSQEISLQTEKFKQQSEEKLLLNQKIQTQSEEIRNLTAQISTLRPNLQYGPVRFAIEAKDTKVYFDLNIKKNPKCFRTWQYQNCAINVQNSVSDIGSQIQQIHVYSVDIFGKKRYLFFRSKI